MSGRESGRLGVGVAEDQADAGLADAAWPVRREPGDVLRSFAVRRLGVDLGIQLAHDVEVVARGLPVVLPRSARIRLDPNASTLATTGVATAMESSCLPARASTAPRRAL